MIRKALLLASAVAALSSVAHAQPTAADHAKAKAALAKSPVFDGHNDLPWALLGGYDSDPDKAGIDGDTRGKLHTDMDRLKQGGVGAQFWSVYIPASMKGPIATQAVWKQIDTARRIIDRRPDRLEFARTANDVVRIEKAGKVASLFGIEGGNAIDGQLSMLREFREAGVAYMTLTHSQSLPWADSGTDKPISDGLSPFGEAVVKEMNRIGMLVDLSHVSPATMKDALRVTRSPVIFSHSSAFGVTPHARNVPDDVLKLVAANKGVVMITFVPGFVSEAVRQWGAEKTAVEAKLRSLTPADEAAVKAGVDAWVATHPEPKASAKDVADHVEHVRKVCGIDCVGLGGDFDGIESTPTDLTGVESYPVLLAELSSRGWTEADLRKLTGENILRVMRANEATVKALAGEKPALLSDTAK